MMESSVIQELIVLIHRYRPKGLIWGKELLLKPKDAIDLVNELELLGIAIWGIDCYYYFDPKSGQDLVEDVGRDLDLSDKITKSDKDVSLSATKARDFLENQLSERTEFVSLFLVEPYYKIEYFPEEPTPNLPH